MAINEISRNGPEVIFSSRIIQFLSRPDVGLKKGVRLFLLEKLLVPLLIQDDPRLRWMVSDVHLLQGV